MTFKVFIAKGFDGFIADEDCGIDWRVNLPNPEGSDFGYSHFMDSVDGVLMGRNTFEKILSFGGEWPYIQPVFVWTSHQINIPENLESKVQKVSGEVQDVCFEIKASGLEQNYVDDGQTIQSFLNSGCIHEMTVTLVPLLLGSGIPLFGPLTRRLELKHMSTKNFGNGMVQVQYGVLAQTF